MSVASRNTALDSSFYAGRDCNYNSNNTCNYYGAQADPLDALRERAALGALHNAAERPDPPKCHPETRTAILDRVDQWMRDQSQDAKPILWLSGAAGAGKSAVAQTLIIRWLQEKIVCPNFFFWRTSPKRNIKTHIILTLAFQLADMLPAARSYIELAVQNASVFDQNLEAQVERLIVTPLLASGDIDRANTEPIVIVIDGLDECCMNLPILKDFPGQSYEDQQREILESIAFACQRMPTLRILIASRPEREIRGSFSDDPLHTLSLHLSINSDGNVHTEIELYLTCKFADIRRRHEGLPSSWPTKDQISQLVKKSSGQFIYPSTVVKYILRCRQHPTRSLEEVLTLAPRSVNQNDYPLAEVDALYTLVLRSVTSWSWEVMRIVLGIVLYTSEDGPRLVTSTSTSMDQNILAPQLFRNIPNNHSIQYFEQLLFLVQGELYTHLTDLHSVLWVDGELSKIRFHHATLSEYLQDETRSGPFFIGREWTYLQCSLLLLKHIAVDQRPSWSVSEPSACQKKVYNPIQYRIDIVRFSFKSQPSKDLMQGLWDLLRGYIGEYSQISEVLPGTYSPNGGLWELDSSFSQKWEFSALLLYLLRCNSAEIEPSAAQRQVVDAHLRGIIFCINPYDPMALEPRQRNLEDGHRNSDSRPSPSRKSESTGMAHHLEEKRKRTSDEYPNGSPNRSVRRRKG